MFNTKQKYLCGVFFFSALNPAVYCLFTLWAEECDSIDLSMKHKTKLRVSGAQSAQTILLPIDVTFPMIALSAPALEPICLLCSFSKTAGLLSDIFHTVIFSCVFGFYL